MGVIALVLLFCALVKPTAASPMAALQQPLRTALGEAQEFVGIWEYRWGDSPRDAAGALRWAQPIQKATGDDTSQQDDSGWQFLGSPATPRPPGRHGNHFLWLRTPLSGPVLDEPTLYIGPAYQLFDVFVDGQLIYHFGTIDGQGPDARRFRGYPMHLILLRPDYQGRTLTVRIYSEHITIGIAYPLRIGSKARLIRDTMVRDLDKVVVGTVLCAIGLFVLGLYLTERKEPAYLYYAGFAFTMGLWLLCQTRSRHLLIPIPLLWSYVEFFSLFTTASFCSLFLVRVIGRGLWGLMPVMAGFFIAYDVTVAILVASGVVRLPVALVCFEIILLPIIGYYLLNIGFLMRQGSGEARLFAAGFVVAMVFAVYDLLAAIGAVPRSQISVTNLGQGGFVVTLGLILVRRFRRVHRDLLTTKSELSEKVQALQVRNAEIEHLNVELRHQIQVRSNQLVTSLINTSSQELAPILPTGALFNERYRIVRIIGQGAMGIVYEVQRVHDGRHFAAKVLTGRPHRRELARFAREAQLLSRLQHKNLVAIADVDVTANRQVYIVMELVEGSTLADQDSHFGELDFALPVLRQLADALATIHAAGIVHRDLKPANILVTRLAPGESPEIKVADFGISALVPEGGDASSSQNLKPQDVEAPDLSPTALAETMDGGPGALTAPVGQTAEPTRSPSAATGNLLTQTGVIMGTPLYMAPELIGGARLARPASDIFSFGVIAYELLTGQLPSETPPMLLRWKPLARFYPALALRCPKLPADLVEIFERCLDAKPENRPTPVELAAVLVA